MHKLLLVSVAALIAASPAQAKGLKWMDAGGVGLPPGAKIAVVKGDPSKAGDFIVRIKMPAGYSVPPHHHPADEAVRVVAGGPLTYGMGEKMDKANSGSLEKGYHITLGAGMNHWVIAPDGGATVQVFCCRLLDVIDVLSNANHYRFYDRTWQSWRRAIWINLVGQCLNHSPEYFLPDLERLCSFLPMSKHIVI